MLGKAEQKAKLDCQKKVFAIPEKPYDDQVIHSDLWRHNDDNKVCST